MTDVFVGFFSVSELEVTAVSQPTVEDNGGYKLILTGAFADLPCQVFIQRAGDTPLPCYSGVMGQGYNPRPLDGNTLEFISPPFPALGGAPWDIRVVQGLNDAQLDAAITPVARNFHAKTFALRRVFPPWYRMGPRNLELVDLVVP